LSHSTWPWLFSQRLPQSFSFPQINGKSLLEVTHNDAVNLFINAGENVTLKVWHGAERILVVSAAAGLSSGCAERG